MTRIAVYFRQHHVGLLALFLALGGTAYAAVEIDKNAIRSSHIGKGQVKRGDIAPNAVNSPKIADGSLTAKDFAVGQLPAGQQGPAGPQGPAGSPDTPQQVLGKLSQTDGPGSGLDADLLDGFGSDAFQRTGSGGFSTGGGGTVAANSQANVEMAGGNFRYHCFTSNASVGWNGPEAEIWIDIGNADPSHHRTTGASRGVSTHAGDRETWMVMTDTRVATITLFSHANTPTDCHWAYTLEEYAR